MVICLEQDADLHMAQLMPMPLNFKTKQPCIVHSSTSYMTKKGNPYSINDCRVPELIPVLGSQPAGDMSHKPGGRLPLLSARTEVTLATLKRTATYFAAW